MGLYFYIAAVVAVISIIVINLLLVYLFKTAPEETESAEPGRNNYDYRGMQKTVTSRRITFVAERSGERFDREFFQALTIGRGTENDLIISDQHTSGRHCRIVDDRGRIYIEDLSSSNGTMVNGIRIMRPTLLNSGDTIQLGSVRYVVYI